MSFTYERRYRGTIQAVLLDWNTAPANESN